MLAKLSFSIVFLAWQAAGAAPPAPAERATIEGRLDEPAQTAAGVADPVKGTAQTIVRFRNDAGADFQLIDARFVMDGTELPVVLADAPRGRELVIYTGPVSAGGHVIATHLTYRGNAHRIFSYMNGYRFSVESDDAFVAAADRSVSLTVGCGEVKGLNVPFERRLAVTLAYSSDVGGQTANRTSSAGIQTP
jgi:hypothetical protein